MMRPIDEQCLRTASLFRGSRSCQDIKAGQWKESETLVIPSMSDTCIPYHDPVNAVVTFGLCIGAIVSFAPQHYRIISKKSSEGISPWYLLLGSTGNAAALFNIITLQWPTILCCPVLSLGSCVESIAGIIQLGLLWMLFTMINVLFLIYYPPHLKYATSSFNSEFGTLGNETESQETTTERSYGWNVSVMLFQVLMFIVILMFSITAYVVSHSNSPDESSPVPDLAHSWALLLGLASAFVTLIQYLPQLLHTWRSRLVGALSIPMMCLQLLGLPLIVWSISRRPGADYTSYLLFVVSGFMQAVLLCMCAAWTIRQRRLGIDAFGNPLKINVQGLDASPDSTEPGDGTREGINEETLLVPKFRVTGAL